MSWLDKIQTDFTITCGDGQRYAPQWLNASKAVEYNVAEFEFKNLEGTLVHRGQAKGRRYNIELYFQGEDHLDRSQAFDTSAANPKAWTIAHPFYGNLRVQPIGLVFDNSNLNVTRITGQVVETIEATPDVPTSSAADTLLAAKESTDSAFAQSFARAVPAPKAKDIQGMLRNAKGSYDAAIGSVRETLDAEKMFNAYNAANSAVNGAASSASGAIGALQKLMGLPLVIAGSVVQKVAMIQSMLAYLGSTMLGIDNRSGKKLYEAQAGSAISTLLAAAVNGPVGTYPSRAKALAMVDTVVSAYNTYLGNLEALQTANAGTPTSYVPDPEPLTQLSQMVAVAVNALLQIAASGRQERSIFLAEPTNLVLLSHQLYGYRADDSGIDELMEINSIGLNEILELPKGRKITYYV